MGFWSTFLEDIDSVFARDPAARSRLEVVLTYPGVQAIWWHRIAHGLWRRHWRVLAKLVANTGRWLTGIEIHPAARIGRRFFIDHGMGVVVGETAEIGDDCTLYHGVTLGGTSLNEGKRHPTLGNRVVVGAGAKVLGPITLGDDARVGSNAVVLRDVPAGATVVGIPGRIVDAQRKPGPTTTRVAERLGFDAYGVAKDMPDPVAEVIDRLLDHVQAVDERMAELSTSIRELGGRVGEAQLPSLEGCHLDPEEGASGCSPVEAPEAAADDSPPRSD